jgi:hypothetical protein
MYPLLTTQSPVFADFSLLSEKSKYFQDSLDLLFTLRARAFVGLAWWAG